MEKHNIDSIRANGIYYTPPTLADFLVKPIIKRADIEIFDPACGEGSLLLSAKKRCSELWSGAHKEPSLVGCDKIPMNGKLERLDDCHIFNCDFLKLSLGRTFDLILMNPPYVRHQLISNEERKEYRKEINKICRFKKSADLWVYFLIKSVSHLKRGGCIGAILPWSFLQSDYAREIRHWLLTRFSRIRVLALSSEYFDGAEERVLLVWLMGYGQEARSVKIAFADHIDERIKYHEMNDAQWEAAKVIFSAKNDVESILQRYVDEFGFSRFGQYATVKIGIVTGADRFFILNRDIAIKRGFRKQNLIPIISTSKELTGLSLDGDEPEKMLIRFPQKCFGKFRHYIAEGEERDYHLRAHSLRRKPWYAVDAGAVPDAFFPYRALSTPYLVFNDNKIQCTNSVHRVYFENLTENARRWIQVSMLSAAGQLSLEAYSKIYGSGVLKIEPSSLINAIVKKGGKKMPAQIYNDISRAISKKDKELAVRLATKFINDTLCIPEDLSSQTISSLDELQSRRLSRS